MSGDTRWFATPGNTQLLLEPGCDTGEITSNTGGTIEVLDLGRIAAATANLGLTPKS